MPYINIRITEENVSKEQKQRIVNGTIQLMVDILDKNPLTTHVVIDEVPVDNWGVNYQLYSDIKRNKNK